jgi:hypothetical protein
MPRYHVQIRETILQMEAPAPQDMTREVRMVDWEGEAADNDAATDAAYAAWDEKYGAGKPPAAPTLRISPLSD